MFKKTFLKKVFVAGALILVSTSLFAGVILTNPQKAEAQIKATDAFALIPGIGVPIASYFRAKDMAIDTVTDAVLFPFKMMGYVARILLTLVLGVVGFIFGFIVDLNFKILDPGSFTYTFITSGWTITRDVANLGFVLFIILIALATIVRYQDYEAKKLLPRLIAAAILVNFSIAIPTVVLNFTHVLGNYFLDGIGNPTQGLSGAMNLSTNIATLLTPQAGLLEEISIDDVAYLAGSDDVNDPVIKGASVTIALFASISFILVTIFVLGTLAVLFVVRFIALHFLFVLAPLVWLFWVIPSLQHTFGEWWKKFFQHAFFLPASIFFIYLVILTGKGLLKVSANLDTSGFVAGGVSESLQTMMRWGAVNFVICAFLIGSIMIARSLSIKGADGAMKLGGDLSTRARNWAGRKTANAGRGAIASKAGKNLANKLSTLGQNSKLSGLAKPVNMLGRILGKTGSDYTEEQKKKARARLTGDSKIDAASYNTAGGGGIFAQEHNKAVIENVTKEGKEFNDADFTAKKDLDKSEVEAKNAFEEQGRKAAYLQKVEDDTKPILDEIIQDIERMKTLKTNNDPTFKQSNFNELLKEKIDLEEKIEGAKTEHHDATKKYETASEDVNKKIDKKKEAVQNFSDFEASTLSQLPNDLRNSLKAADFKIENVVAKGDFNKTLDMGKSLKGVIPEKSLNKVQGELAKLNSRLSKAQTDLTTKKGNPLESKKSIQDTEDLVKQLTVKKDKTQGWVTRRETLKTELEREQSIARVIVRPGMAPTKETKSLKAKMDKLDKEINRMEALSPVNKFMSSKPKKDDA